MYLFLVWPLPHPAAAASGFNPGYGFLNPTDSFYGKKRPSMPSFILVLAQQMNQYTHLAMQNPDHFNQALQQVQQMAGFPPSSALQQVKIRKIRASPPIFPLLNFISSCRHRPTCQTTTLQGTHPSTDNSLSKKPYCDVVREEF